MPASKKPAGPVPDGTPQFDDSGRCLFCKRRDDHVHPEPRPKKSARAATSRHAADIGGDTDD